MAYTNTPVRRKKRVKRKTRRARKTKENSSIYLGLVGFILISIYLFGYLFLYINKSSISIEPVQYGSIGEPKTYDGLVIRDEHVIKSVSEGEVTHYYGEGDRVKKNAIVCSIKNVEDSDELEQQISNNDNEIVKVQKSRSDISLIQDDIDLVNNKIENITSNYITGSIETRLNNLYSFKNELNGEVTLRNQILLTENRGSLKSLVEEKFAYEALLGKTKDMLYAPISGIVSFSLDGLEEIYSVEKIETLLPEQINMKFEPPSRINSGNIKIDEPVFKVINSNEWYIVSYIPDEVCNGWLVDDQKKLIFNDEQSNFLNVRIKSITQAQGQKLIVFYSDRNMIDYINTRSISFEVETEIYKGLKVPNSSIVEQTFLKIPMDYIIDDSGQYSIIKSQDKGNISVPIKIAFKDETQSYAYILQDFNSTKIKLDDKILKNTDGEEKEYIITGEGIRTSSGVYVANNGIASLKAVEIIGSNETYSIVKPVGDLKVYDRIVSDARNISENQMIY